mgnify:CR=1 FL=1
MGIRQAELAALLQVALVAGLVDRVGLEQGGVERAVRVVAIHAADLAFRQRHVRAAVELLADVLVAGGAGRRKACRRVSSPLVWPKSLNMVCLVMLLLCSG